MKIIKIFGLFLLVLISFVPLIVSSTYVFSGFDKTTFIKALVALPESRFWLTGIPLFIVCFYATFKFLWELIHLDTGTPRHDVSPRKPVQFYVEDPIHYYPALAVEDPNLGEKIKALYF